MTLPCRVKAEIPVRTHSSPLSWEQRWQPPGLCRPRELPVLTCSRLAWEPPKGCRLHWVRYPGKLGSRKEGAHQHPRRRRGFREWQTEMSAIWGAAEGGGHALMCLRILRYVGNIMSFCLSLKTQNENLFLKKFR